MKEQLKFLGETQMTKNCSSLLQNLKKNARSLREQGPIYKYALDHIPKKEAQELYKMWISFEKKNGDR
jgi:hypothetical protein